jgi:hypothetical protein
MSTYADTSRPFGAPTITINSVTYIVEGTFKVDRKTNVKRLMDGEGNENGSFGLATIPTATATLQKATSSTAEPPITQTFTYTADATIGSETWQLVSVSSARPQGEVHTFDIEAIKDMNA